MARGQRGRIAGRARRLHPDDPHIGPDRLDRHRDARRETAAADAHDDGPHLGALFEDLQPHRALPGDDVRVVEGVDEDRTGLLGVLLRGGQRLVHHMPVQPDLGPVLTGRGHLRQRRPDRHEDRRPYAEQRRRECDTLRMVSGARGDDPGRPLHRRQTRDTYVRAAQFERAGPLEVLALEVDRRTHQVGQVAAAFHGGHPGHSGEHLLRSADVVEDQRGKWPVARKFIR